jgi:predicted RND superfamily exporter protein
MKQDLLDRITNRLVNRAGLLLAVCFVVAAAFATQIPRLTADFTPSDLFASFGDQEEVAAEFRSTFGNTDNVLLVLLEGEDVLDKESLETTARLTARIRDLEDVVRLESITSLPTRHAGEDSAAATTKDASVTDAYFDLYDLSAGLVSSAGRAGSALGVGEAPETEETDAEDTASAAQAEEARTAPEAQQVHFAPVISGPPVSDAEAERVRELVDSQGLIRGRLLSEDGTLSAIAVFLHEERLKNEQIAESLNRIEDTIDTVEVPDGERVLLGGLPYIRKSVVDNLRSDQTILLPSAIFVSLLILFAAFRWWAAMVLPTIAVALSALILVGGMALVGEPFNILNNIVPTLVIVIGISDSIHVISRYRDGIGAGTERRRAAVDALKTMTIACFLTSFTTAVGFLSLGVSDTEILQRFGVTAAVGVMIAYLLTITFVPAALSLVKPPSTESVKKDHGLMENLIETITRTILRYRFVVVAVATALVVGAVWIGRTIHVDSAVLDQVNQESQVYKTTRLVEEKLGGIRPLEFFLRAEDEYGLAKPEVTDATRELIEWGREQEGVLGSLTYTDFLQQARRFATGVRAEGEAPPLDDEAQNRALYNLLYRQQQQNPLLSYLVDDAQMGRATLTLRDMGARQTNEFITRAEQKVDELFGPIEGVEVRITGDAFSGSRGLDAVITDLIGSLTTAVVIIFVFLTILFRSLRLGLLSVPPNLMPLALTLGYMTLRGVPLNTATAIIFSISIGLAVDGTIHYLARFREELEVDDDVEEALVRAARGTGKAIFITCVALIVGFGVMLVSQFVPIRRFGELIAVTVFGMLIATTLVLPALIDIGYGIGRSREESTEP